jgi:hypothetical protein
VGKFNDFLQKFSRTLAGLLLIIFALAFFVSACAEAAEIEWRDRNPALFAWGAAAFLLIHLLFKRRPFLYVFGHEISHAIATTLSGGQVQSIYVSSGGGTTKTEKSNLFILLFPYFFPFYASIVLLAFTAIRWAGDASKAAPYYYFLTGLTLAHHLFFTVYFIFKGQSDIRKAGTIFGIGLVSAANVWIYAFFFSRLFGGFSMSRCLGRAVFFFKEILG